MINNTDPSGTFYLLNKKDQKVPTETNNSEEEVAYPPPPSKRDYKTTNEYRKALRTYYKEKEEWEKENEE